jgi:ribose transport system substrate-binding protein
MRLAVFTKNKSNPAYAAARLGAERTAARFGATVTHYVPRKPDDVDEQTALVAEALGARPDAFVFVPVHVTAMKEPIGRVLEAGVPVANFLNRIDAPGFLTFVGADDYALAREIALYLGRRLDGRGTILMVEGMLGATTNTDRMRGFRDAMAAFPGIDVLASLPGEYQQDAARRAMDGFLSSETPVDAVLAANDSMALGVIEALEARGRHAIVTGVNAVPDAIEAVKRGTLLATVDFDAMKIASIATEAAIRHLRGETVPREIMLPARIVDRTNYAAWDKPLEARELPRWDEIVQAG